MVILLLNGVCTVTLTPFNENGKVDVHGIKSLTDFYINAGVHGLTVLGMMGEANKLTDEERFLVMQSYIQQADGRVPVIVGCTANGTDVAIHYAKEAEASGATAVMVAPPSRQTNLELVFEHYQRIASAINIPLVVQDEPVNTGVKCPAEFLARLINNISNCQYIKLEEAPTPIKTTGILNNVREDVRIFGGLFGMYFYEELERGASGIMTGFSYPEILVETYRLYTTGQKDEARSYFNTYLPLIRFEGQLGVGGVGIRKELFKARGLIASSTQRFPAPKVDQQTIKDIEKLVDFLGLKEVSL